MKKNKVVILVVISIYLLTQLVISVSAAAYSTPSITLNGTTISWEAVDVSYGASKPTAYHIYWSGSDGSSASTIIPAGQNMSYTIQTQYLKYDVTYSFYVKATAANTIWSPASNTVQFLFHSYYLDWKKDSSSHWFECRGCGYKQDKTAHNFDNSCDVTCNDCLYVRTINHSPNNDDGDCTTPIKCRVCNIITTNGKLRHNFTNDCDSTCDNKGCTFERIGTHSYDNNCDAECNICNNIRTVSHLFGNWNITTAPSCTTKGIEKRYCSTCNKAENRDISETGHSLGKWETTKQPTCITKGEETKKCSECSYKETREMEAKGHNYSKEWTIDIKSTCTTTGSKSHHCLNCDSKTDLTNIAPTGHNFGEWEITKEPTTKVNGVAQRKCKNSGCVEVETKTIAKLAEDGHTHKFGDWETKEKSTCTKNGQNIRKCTICSESETSIILFKGHNFDDWETEKKATCTVDGSIVRICKICKEKETNIISHTGHAFGEAVVTKEATETEAGLKTKTCTVCGETKKEEIPYLTAEPEAPAEDKKTDATVDADNKDGGNNMLWIIIAIVSVVLIAGAVVTVILIKKKKASVIE